MKFSENWLREFVDPDISSEALVDKLNMLGLEVDTYTPALGDLSGVVIGKVTKINSHPNADKLKVCKVDAGNNEILQIVCGASNVQVDKYYPLAKVGAKLPNGMSIKQAKLRGVESHGMLCSEAELGLQESSSGLMELPEQLTSGDEVTSALGLDDQLIEIDLTPNRGDCLSVLGVARDIAAATQTPLNKKKSESIKPKIKDKFSIEIKAPQACPRYVGRVIKGINPAAETPFWMKEKLRKSGLRPIHPVVDVANFVMLEIGQPMHGFDLHKLNDGIIVRMAEAGENIELLDGNIIDLKDNTLVIADHKNACAIAGIMGGKDTAVSDTTTDILLESAYFAPQAIIGRGRQYGLHTDSSHRFERGVDHQLQTTAVERATQLILEITGGQAGPVMDNYNNETLPALNKIQLRQAQIKRRLGIELDAAIVKSYLSALGMEVSKSKQGWEIISPSYRFDIELEADLIEELVRLYGYENLPRTLPTHKPKLVSTAECKLKSQCYDQVLIDRGYQEIITYSFIDPELHEQLFKGEQAIVLSNPISSEMAVMRTSLIPGLLSGLKYNLNRQQKRLQIYEKGLRFVSQPTNIKQENLISGLIYGPRYEENWATGKDTVDFYDIKGDVEALLSLADFEQYRFEPVQLPLLHPGQSAKILKNDETVGYLGALHPKISKQQDLDAPVYVFELLLSGVEESCLPVFQPLSKYTHNRRDIAIVIDESVTWAQVKKAIFESGESLLKEAHLFDVYTGKNMISGRKSFAIGLILQEISRTLTDNEIDAAVDQVLAVLNKNLGATLRE